MAELSNDKTYVTVEPGDTLSEIAEQYAGGASKTQWLADINGISNPNSISVGQKIMLSKTVSYFAKYTGSSGSIVTALKSIGEKSSYSYRCEIAKLNNITPYSGTAAQNTKMLSLLKQGKLIKAGSASQTASSTATNTNTVTITNFGLQAGSDNTLFATWTWHKEKDTESYLVIWEYYSKDKVWLVGSDSTISVNEKYLAASRQATYSIPANATAVRMKIKPISKKKKDGEKETDLWPAYFTDWNSFNINQIPPAAPSAPTVEIDKYKLTATLENLKWDELNATSIKFEVVKNDESSYTTGTVSIDTNFNRVSYSCDIEAGNEYRVRCKSIRDNLESDWSDLSGAAQAIPSTPASINQCNASGETADGYSVYLEWDSVYSADTYDVEYTNKQEYFDNPSGDVTNISTADESAKLTIYKLAGGEYFFRVRAVNEQGSSDWSTVVSIKLGEPPAAPTTWSSTTTAIIGESMTLYWVHNSEDGSSQTWAQIELDVNGDVSTIEVKNSTDLDEKDKTSFYVLDTSVFATGAQVKWRVCTAGITNTLGDWSVQRTIDVYAPPVLELSVTDSFEILEDGSIQLMTPEGGVMETLGAFPFYVKAVAGPREQIPVGYHLTITANDTYETVDAVGNTKTVSEGTQVYSKYFDIATPLLVEFSANNLDLENGVRYTIKCTVSMNSGLTAEASSVFTVSWADMVYLPNAEITINRDVYSASIRPYCEERYSTIHLVYASEGEYEATEYEIDEQDIDSVFTVTGEKIFIGANLAGDTIRYCKVFSDENGNPIDPIYYEVNLDSLFYKTNTVLDPYAISPVYTTTGEELFFGMTPDGAWNYFCVVTKTSLVEDVLLSVYRREFDGSFTELGSGIDNTQNTFITDPHPALDYARYRVVATTKSTGAVSYYDLPGTVVGGKAVIIQWDEAWSSFNNWTEDRLAQPAWTGSLLKLPYNIDVSDSNDLDVTQVKYIGRKRPVTYYGTQLGETSSWSVTIEKDDEETIYALRRLAIWMGDVYVREPSGTGYWANIKVSFSQTHCELTIPVTLDITRVEGGI